VYPQSQIGAIKGGKKGRLLIGCSSPLASYLLPVVLPKYISKYPEVELKLFEQNHNSLVELLSSGSIDLIVSTRVLENSIFQRIQLFEEEMILLAPKSFSPRLVDKVEGKRFPILDFNLLNKQPFFLLESKNYFRQIVDDIFAKHKIRPNIILETNNWETCYAMVLEGLGFTITSDSLFKKDLINDKRVQKFSIDGNSNRVISIYCRKGTYNINRINDFVDSTKETLATLITQKTETEF
jgi:DNA-binding transcriptional LysR family regulator